MHGKTADFVMPHETWCSDGLKINYPSRDTGVERTAYLLSFLHIDLNESLNDEHNFLDRAPFIRHTRFLRDPLPHGVSMILVSAMVETQRVLVVRSAPPRQLLVSLDRRSQQSLVREKHFSHDLHYTGMKFRVNLS